MNGTIDEFQIWSRALTPTEVTELYNSDTGMTYSEGVGDFISGDDLRVGQVSYYKFDGDATDSHGSNDGTVSGATSTSSGKINDAYDFDGTNDYIDTNNTNILSTNAFSISAWINPSALTGNHPIIGQWSTNDYNIIFRVESDGYVNAFLKDSSLNNVNVESTTQLTTGGGWYHVVLTSTGTSTKLYVNGGTAEDTASHTSRSIDTVDDIYIGSRAESGNYFAGIIDEVGIWNRELSSTEVTELYNSDDGLQYPYSTTPAVTYNSNFFGVNF
jgi:hypothetical protein